MSRIKLMTALLAVVLCIGLAGSTIASQEAQPGDMESVLRELLEQGETENISEEMPLYCFSAEEESTIRIMYMEGFEVPNVSVRDWTELMNQVTGEEFEMVFSAQDSTAVITRKNGSTVTFDNKTGTVEFSDLNAFLQKMEEDDPAEQHAGRDACFRKSSNSYVRKGNPVNFDLTSYGIKMYQDEEDFYVPMQTLGDLMLAPLGINLYYNGEAVVIAWPDDFETEDGLTPLGELFYSVSPGGRNEDLALYSYQELCLVLDHFYGLKESHQFSGFDQLFSSLGYQDLLKSTNPKIADEALYRTIFFQLDDPVSSFLAPSPFSGKDMNYPETVGISLSARNRTALAVRWQDALADSCPDGIPGYEEVDNTAFITLPSFEEMKEDTADYYETEPDENTEDTMGLLLYAFRQITREESPIEHVVMDLSVSGSGDMQAAAFAIAFFLGEADLCTEDSLTGDFSCDIYEIDWNLDHRFDEQDQLPNDINLYCLISPVTAGPAAVTAGAFRSSGLVTMLGQATRGSSCIEQPLATAGGTSYRIAGRIRLSVLKNGVFYDIDSGIEPDYPIMIPDAFYDREAMSELIAGLPFGSAGWQNNRGNTAS